MKRQELQVAALENGTVIDHIPSSKLFDVISLLHLETVHSAVTVGYNLKSKKMRHKSIIKSSFPTTRSTSSPLWHQTLRSA